MDTRHNIKTIQNKTLSTKEHQGPSQKFQYVLVTCKQFMFHMSQHPCYLRNKSWKPECVGSFTMDWQILIFYPEPEARDKID
jgi:hypothetical protein